MSLQLGMSLQKTPGGKKKVKSAAADAQKGRFVVLSCVVIAGADASWPSHSAVIVFALLKHIL